MEIVVLIVFAIVLLLVINDWCIRSHNKRMKEEETIRVAELAERYTSHKIPDEIVYIDMYGNKEPYRADEFGVYHPILTYPTIDESLIDGKPDTDTVWDMSQTPKVLDTKKNDPWNLSI